MTLQKLNKLLGGELAEFNENNPYKILDDFFWELSFIGLIIFKNTNIINPYRVFLSLYLSSNVFSCLLYYSIKKENWIELSETNFFKIKHRILYRTSFLVILMNSLIQVNQLYFYIAIFYYLIATFFSFFSKYVNSFR